VLLGAKSPVLGVILSYFSDAGHVTACISTHYNIEQA